MISFSRAFYPIYTDVEENSRRRLLFFWTRLLESIMLVSNLR
jgi:hypothetical protein